MRKVDAQEKELVPDFLGQGEGMRELYLNVVCVRLPFLKPQPSICWDVSQGTS